MSCLEQTYSVYDLDTEEVKGMAALPCMLSSCAMLRAGALGLAVLRQVFSQPPVLFEYPRYQRIHGSYDFCMILHMFLTHLRATLVPKKMLVQHLATQPMITVTSHMHNWPTQSSAHTHTRRIRAGYEESSAHPTGLNCKEWATKETGSEPSRTKPVKLGVQRHAS